MGYHLSSTVPRLARRSIPAVEAELQALPPPSPRLDRPPPDSATALRDAFRLDKTVLLFGLLMHSAAQVRSLGGQGCHVLLCPLPHFARTMSPPG